MKLKLLCLALLLAATGASLRGQAPLNIETNGNGFTQHWSSAARITRGQIVKLDQSSSRVTPMALTDTSGALGVAVSETQSAGADLVVSIGGAPLVQVDGACAVGNVVLISSIVAGAGHCAASASGQTIGQAITTSAGTGFITVQLSALSSSGSSTPQVFPGAGVPNSNGSGYNASYPVTGGGTSVALCTPSSPLPGDLFAFNSSSICVNKTPGVAGRSVSIATDTISCTSGTGDRGGLITYTNTGLVTVTIPQAGTGACVSNFYFRVNCIGAGGCKLVSTTSTINTIAGATGVTWPGNTSGDCISPDNANWTCTGFRVMKGGLNNTEVLNADQTVTLNGSAGGTFNFYAKRRAYVTANGSGALNGFGFNIGTITGNVYTGNNATATLPANVQTATAATINTNGGFDEGGNFNNRIPDNPILFGYIALGQTTTTRWDFGLVSVTGATMLASATPTMSGAYFSYDTGSGVDTTHYLACTGNAAAAVCTSTGILADTAYHQFLITVTSGTNVVFSIDGTATNTVTTNLPGTTIVCQMMNGIQTLAAVAENMKTNRIYLEGNQ